MTKSVFGAATIIVAPFHSATGVQGPTVSPQAGESHFANIRQVTFGGENAEAYFSRDGKQLIFQRQERSR